MGFSVDYWTCPYPFRCRYLLLSYGQGGSTSGCRSGQVPSSLPRTDDKCQHEPGDVGVQSQDISERHEGLPHPPEDGAGQTSSFAGRCIYEWLLGFVPTWKVQDRRPFASRGLRTRHSQSQIHHQLHQNLKHLMIDKENSSLVFHGISVPLLHVVKSVTSCISSCGANARQAVQHIPRPVLYVIYNPVCSFHQHVARLTPLINQFPRPFLPYNR